MGGLEREEVRAVLWSMLREAGRIETDALTEASTIEDDLKIESIRFVELQVAIEEHYDIQLDPITIIELNELGKVLDYVWSQAKQRWS